MLLPDPRVRVSPRRPGKQFPPRVPHGLPSVYPAVSPPPSTPGWDCEGALGLGSVCGFPSDRQPLPVLPCRFGSFSLRSEASFECTQESWREPCGLGLAVPIWCSRQPPGGRCVSKIAGTRPRRFPLARSCTHGSRCRWVGSSFPFRLSLLSPQPGAAAPRPARRCEVCLFPSQGSTEATRPPASVPETWEDFACPLPLCKVWFLRSVSCCKCFPGCQKPLALCS